MGRFEFPKVMVSGPLVVLVLLAWSSEGSALLCPRGKQYLNVELQRCVNCTQCDGEKGFVVLRPCDVHKDTLCGPIEKLKLLLEFPTNKPEPPHRHRHRHNKIFGNLEEEPHKKVFTSDDDYTNIPSEAPFTSAETLIWDWQDITLTLAVFVCILFFIVIALYSLHQAKQWRKLKENFDADVEELSTRLSLMAAASNEKGEVLEPSFNPVNDGNYLNNRCMYLEQLLNVRKDLKLGSDGGNVYIEEVNTLAKT